MLKSEFLGTLSIDLDRSYCLDQTPAGWRRIDVFGGGSLRGPRVNGIIVSGTDCILRRQDQSMQPDVRLTIETEDNAYIYVSYRGIRHGTAEAMAKISVGLPVSPDEYYLRCAPFFETGAPRYDWLNRIVSIGVGRREPAGAVYEIHEIL